MPELQNLKSNTRSKRDIENHEMLETDAVKESNSLFYSVDDAPPWLSCITLATQQFLFTVGSVATFPVILMPLLCYEDSQNVEEYRSIISSNCLLITGISTILQTTFGSRLPTMQATSISYFVAAMSVFNSVKWKCPAQLAQNISALLQSNISTPSDFPMVNSNGSNMYTMKIYAEYDGTYRNNEEVWMSRMRMMQGSILICGVTHAFLGASGAIGSLAKYIGPLTVTPVLVMVTYTLCDVILGLCRIHWGIAGITLATFFVTSVVMENIKIPIPQCSVRRKTVTVSMIRYPLFPMFTVMFSVVVGWLAYFTMPGSTGSDATSATSNRIASVPWVRLQYPFRFGAPIFVAEGILGLLVAIIPTTLEAIGHYAATSAICNLPPTPTHAVNRGILVQGIATVLFASFGVGSGATFWTTNTAVISMSRAGSRRIFQFTGLFMILVSIFPKSISIFALMPEPVVGGLLLGTIGAIFAVGVSSLQTVNMTKNRNLFILGFSVVAGIVIPKYFTTSPEAITQPLGTPGETILILLQSPMLISGILAFILDNISPGTKQDRGLQESHAAKVSNASSSDSYNLPFKTDCSVTKWIPFCPSYNSSTIRSCEVYRHIRNVIIRTKRRESAGDV